MRRQRVEIQSLDDLQEGDILVHKLEGHENRYPCKVLGGVIHPFCTTERSGRVAWDDLQAMRREGAYVLREVPPLPDDTLLKDLTAQQIVDKMGDGWLIDGDGMAENAIAAGHGLWVGLTSVVYYGGVKVPSVTTIGQLRKLSDALEGK